MYFYFPLPAITTVLLDLVMPYGVAFKLVTIVGLVVLPTVSYFFVKFLGLPKFVAAVAGVAGSLFVFMESYSIFGANIKSTLAGEFSFSWSFALSILYVGLVVRNYRNDRAFDPWAGIVLGLTAMSHIITTIVVVVATLPLVLAPVLSLFKGRDTFRLSLRRSSGVVWSYVVGFGLSAFWSVALGVNVLSGMTSDMGWAPVTTIIGNYQSPGSPIPGEPATEKKQTRRWAPCAAPATPFGGLKAKFTRAFTLATAPTRQLRTPRSACAAPPRHRGVGYDRAHIADHHRPARGRPRTGDRSAVYSRQDLGSKPGRVR